MAAGAENGAAEAAADGSHAADQRAPPAEQGVAPVRRPVGRCGSLAAGPRRICCSNWCTQWGATEEQKRYWPKRHSDYRDSAPEQLEAVYRLYQPMVEYGRWTEGLLEMWFWKNKPVKHSVHIPCWDSFKWNPLKWRGPVLGRTAKECYWTGNRQMRWARAIYAANLGREYVMPVRDIGRHGYKSDIKALCWMYYLMGCIFGCGVGQLVTLCGASACMNFAACFSCHARERLRRRYGLPPAFGLPPGIDDCLVHFFCFYCASHQEARELAVRGIDGPGMHILDVLPNSFNGVEGIEEVKAARRQRVEAMVARPPKIFRARGPKKQQQRTFRLQVALGAAAIADALEGEREPDDFEVPLDEDETASVSTSDASSAAALGWCTYCAPEQQEMCRAAGAVGPEAARQQQRALRAAAGSGGAWCGGSDPPWSSGPGHQQQQQLARHSIHHIPVVHEPPPAELRKAWSVAY